MRPRFRGPKGQGPRLWRVGIPPPHAGPPRHGKLGTPPPLGGPPRHGMPTLGPEGAETVMKNGPFEGPKPPILGTKFFASEKFNTHFSHIFLDFFVFLVDFGCLGVIWTSLVQYVKKHVKIDPSARSAEGKFWVIFVWDFS